MIGVFGYDCRAKASETGEQVNETVTLAVPQNVREENGFIVWDETDGAYGYTIQASRGESVWEYTWYENKIEWSRFIYEQCFVNACGKNDFGDYTFRVSAFDESRTATEFSSPVTVSYQAAFPMPTNVRLSETNSRELTWDEVEGAARYNIRIYKKDEYPSIYSTSYTASNSYWIWEDSEYLVAVQAMDQDYHVSEWTETVLTTPFAQLAIPQNIRFDESGENIIWDKVENADYYYVSTGSISGTSCEQPILENWKQYLSPMGLQ